MLQEDKMENIYYYVNLEEVHTGITMEFIIKHDKMIKIYKIMGIST